MNRKNLVQDEKTGLRARVSDGCDEFYSKGDVCTIIGFDGMDWWGDFNNHGNDTVHSDGRWCIGQVDQFEII